MRVPSYGSMGLGHRWGYLLLLGDSGCPRDRLRSSRRGGRVRWSATPRGSASAPCKGFYNEVLTSMALTFLVKPQAQG